LLTGSHAAAFPAEDEDMLPASALCRSMYVIVSELFITRAARVGQAVCELAARAAEDGPMVAAVPGHVHAARAANDLALDNKQGGDPSQRTPVRLDLNNIFHGGSTPATHLALQVGCGAAFVVTSCGS